MENDNADDKWENVFRCVKPLIIYKVKYDVKPLYKGYITF